MTRRTEHDLYGVLGVGRDATAGEIRRAYRRLARQQHPDLNPGTDGSGRFAALTNAYEILHDPVRRGRYDRTLVPSSAAEARITPEQVTRTVPADGRILRQGTLELSPYEVAQLARCHLTLRDAQGQTIVLPAGTRHGDRITVLHDGHPAMLTVRMQARA